MPDLTAARVAEIIDGLPEGCGEERTCVRGKHAEWMFGTHSLMTIPLELMVAHRCQSIVRWLNAKGYEVQIRGPLVRCEFIAPGGRRILKGHDTLLESLAACAEEVAGGE